MSTDHVYAKVRLSCQITTDINDISQWVLPSQNSIRSVQNLKNSLEKNLV